MKSYFLLFFIQLCIFSFAPAQNSEMIKKVVDHINEARTNPAAFLKANRAAIEKYNPKYIGVLSNAKPISKVVWDKALVQMAKESVESGDLNPEYKGSNKICGRSAGSSSGNISKDPLSYLCRMYTNIHDEDYRFLGFYFNKDLSGFNFQWGISCERKKLTYTFNGKVDLSKVAFKTLNTAYNESYLSEVEKKMVEEVNFVRAYPKVYADIIKQYLHDESRGLFGISKDTYDAGLELIAELQEQEPRSILQPMHCVYKAAKNHGLDCKRRGFFDHTGSDESAPWDRILKACPALTMGNENGAGNPDEDPRIAVISLLLDDGISSRGHRYNMLNADWKYIGCYRYSDKTYGYHWVQNFAY